ncbi:Choline-sulfatase [Rubripirellula obstinata]|uniref:Choline-sulfatase n=1 Tax=Rubripirellula obstinata TaxID=406547 RepID=A0A5B1CLB8_9BACT|nr:sulfatase [Rubripirellula obstinata]KAA1260163.1 Choline-sulfatase [Rubripirellula obstinata]
MKRFSPFLSSILLAFAAAMLLTSPSIAETTEKKNVLIFFIDDLRPELGCYGADYIKSPSIDSLANEGVLFERAYCQQALCAPSRISMMSGQYPDSTGICDLFTPLRRVNKTAMTMPLYFKQNGYTTASFGKVYHHLRDDKANWSEVPQPPSENYANPETLQAIAQRTKQAKDQGVSVKEMRLAAKGPATEIYEVDDEGYRDGVVAKQAIESLRNNKDNPFFMCVGFAKPHLPFAAPKRYWDLYQRDQFTVPSRELPKDTPRVAITIWGELRSYLGIPDEGELSDEKTKELMHGYAASVSFADAQVGKVMDELDRLGLREDTIVVLWGDHGYKLGDYGLWCKHTNLELDARVPMIISAPGHAVGQRSQALVEVVDLFPTVASMATGEVPESCDGRSLEPVLENPNKEFRPFALSQYPRGAVMGYSMRTDRWRYTEWIKASTKEVTVRELYDHQETQTPTVNLANAPEYAGLVSRLSKQLNAAAKIEASKVKMPK